MGYLEELECFYNEIQEEKPRDLSYEKLIRRFLQYMAQTYGYDEAYYRKDFNLENQEYKDFNEYIYKCHMGLDKDLRREYERIESEAKNRIKMYEERVSDLNVKMESISEGNKYIKEKYKFLLDINEELLEKAKKAREKSSVFQAARNCCIEIPAWFSGIWSFDDTFGDIEQYENIDWKSKINFLEAPITYGKELAKMKQSNSEQYLAAFKSYIDVHKIPERLLHITSENYYLHDRQEIIKEAINLFRTEKYIAFVYLLVPQIEGLFDVYISLLEIDNKKRRSGLSEKLHVIHESHRLWGYVYYAFEFPVLRNDIAHGNMVCVTPEMAYDTLMDIFYLFHEIESEDRQYKIFLNFLNEFSDKQLDKRVAYVLDYFSNLQEDNKLKWLEICLDGSYDDMIVFYDHMDTFTELKVLFNSEQFRKAIYDYEPLKIRIDDEYEGKQISYKKLNREVTKYMPLLELLKSYVDFPQIWMSSIEQRLHDIAEEDKIVRETCCQFSVEE